MNDYAVHARSLAAAKARLGDDCPVVTWGGRDYPVIPGSAARRQDLAAGGFQLNADFHFEALVSDWLTNAIPDVKQLKGRLLQTPVGYLGSDYKPISVTIRPGGLQMLVDCNSTGQNA
jgi:hypothetical protein